VERRRFNLHLLFLSVFNLVVPRDGWASGSPPEVAPGRWFRPGRPPECPGAERTEPRATSRVALKNEGPCATLPLLLSTLSLASGLLL
jgi:hypothetical protein